MPRHPCLRFNDEPTIMGPTHTLLTSSTEMESVDNSNIYYSPQELREIRSDAKQLGVIVSKKQDLSNPLAYKNVMERSYKECVKGGIPSLQDMEYFIHWTSACPMRRGLERVCVPTLGAARTKRTNFCVAAVLETQRRSNAEEREAKMRSVSEKLSMPSKSLARVHGIVDACVARQADDFYSKKRNSNDVEGKNSEGSPCAKSRRSVTTDAAGLTICQRWQGVTMA